MHLFRQQAVKDFAAAAAKIPVIDYGRISPARRMVYRGLVPAFSRANYFHQRGHTSRAAALAGAAD